MFAKSNRTATG